MIVNRTEQIYIKENKTVSMMCHLSKNLFHMKQELYLTIPDIISMKSR